MHATKQRESWLPPIILILLILEVLFFPLAASQTYAGRSESPQHVLTYTPGQLTWDGDTQVDETGSAMLDLFSTTYDNVESSNGESVVTPGTENTNLVRLANHTANPVEYVAVLYRIKEETDLPVEPELRGQGFTLTDEYPLPPGVAESQVVQAVTGTLDGGQVQDFDLTWVWNYYDSDQRDVVDTALGNRAAFAQPDEVTAGLYILVMDEGQFIIPRTGDSQTITPYVGLMVVCGVLLLLLLVGRRRKHI